MRGGSTSHKPQATSHKPQATSHNKHSIPSTSTLTHFILTYSNKPVPVCQVKLRSISINSQRRSRYFNTLEFKQKFLLRDNVFPYQSHTAIDMKFFLNFFIAAIVPFVVNAQQKGTAAAEGTSFLVRFYPFSKKIFSTKFSPSSSYDRILPVQWLFC